MTDNIKKIIIGAGAVVVVGTLGYFLFSNADSSDSLELDLKKIGGELTELTDGKFSRTGFVIFTMTAFNSELESIYDYNMNEVLGFKASLYEDNDNTIYYNEGEKELLAIVNPVDGKEDKVRSELETLCEKLDGCDIIDHENYIIAVSSNDNDEVLESVKASETPIYGNFMDDDSSMYDVEMLEMLTEITSDEVDEFVMSSPGVITSAATFIIVKPTEGNEESVKTKLDAYMLKLESEWEMYLPDQYELVKNRTVEEHGDYLIYIVSTDNDLVLETIKGE